MCEVSCCESLPSRECMGHPLALTAVLRCVQAQPTPPCPLVTLNTLLSSPPLLQSHAEGTDRFLLDGFPRTAQQAAALDAIADVKLAVNLGLREEVRATGLQGLGSKC